MKTDVDFRIGDQGENLRDVLCQLQYINQRIACLMPEGKRLECEQQKGHPLFNLKMSIYWLRHIEFAWRPARLGLGVTKKAEATKDAVETIKVTL